jgi:putative transposase
LPARRRALLSDPELEDYLARVVPSEQGRALVRAARSSAPKRNVSNSAGNWAGTYPSRKIQFTNFFESWSGERALLLFWDFDSDVLEVWAQAVDCPVRYRTSRGTTVGVRTIVDFLVLRRDGISLTDYKTTNELQKLVVDAPGRWEAISPTRWDQPPVRQHFEGIGLDYALLTDRDIPHLLVRNIEFLRSRLEQPVEVPEDTSNRLLAKLHRDRRVRLTEAILLLGDASRVYQGHFENRWILNLPGEPVALPDSCFVYKDHPSLAAFTCVDRSRVEPAIRPGTPEVHTLDTLLWDDTRYEVLHAGPQKLYIRSGNGPVLPLTRADLNDLSKAGAIRVQIPPASANSLGLEVLLRASDESILNASEKLAELDLYWSGQETTVPRRTLFAYQSAYRAAEEAYGNGFIGLIDRNDLKGNRTPRTGPVEWECRQQAFEWLCAPMPRDPSSGHAYYSSLCDEKGITPLSLQAFLSAWNRLDEHARQLLRQGRRAAYPQKPPRTTQGNHIKQGPPEGDSPFQLVHIDHVQSDIFARRLNGSKTLAKPWFSIAIDAFTRLVLALWVSLLPPSHAAVMMVLRDIVRRHRRLPLWVITDGGKDFKSELVQKFLAQKNCGHATRPNGEPRFGNPVERLNLDIASHLGRTTLGGNEVLKKPRMSSSTHDPRLLAQHTVPYIAARAQELFFDTYPHLFHAGLQQSPFDKMAEASLLQGASWGRPATFDDALVFQTLVRARKHGGLIRHRDGIRVNEWSYYCNAISGNTSARCDVPLYDPENPRYVWARIDKTWHRAPMIDSQLKRLPPEEDLRFFVDEHIYLSRHSTHKSAKHESSVLLGNFYRRGEAVDSNGSGEAEFEEGVQPEPAEQPPSLAAPGASAPVSWREVQ